MRRFIIDLIWVVWVASSSPQIQRFGYSRWIQYKWNVDALGRYQLLRTLWVSIALQDQRIYCSWFFLNSAIASKRSFGYSLLLKIQNMQKSKSLWISIVFATSLSRGNTYFRVYTWQASYVACVLSHGSSLLTNFHCPHETKNRKRRAFRSFSSFPFTLTIAR